MRNRAKPFDRVATGGCFIELYGYTDWLIAAAIRS